MMELLLSGPQFLCQMKVEFSFYLEINDPETNG